MQEKALLVNSNILFFLDKEKCEQEFINRNKFSAVLLTSWNTEKQVYDEIRFLIESLIDNGCRYFVCAGYGAEVLHDYIDDILLLKDSDCALDVVTTWHDSDSLDDVSHFFLYSIDVYDSSIAAFLEGENANDIALKKYLLRDVE